MYSRHREGQEMELEGVARSELSCDTVVLTDPEALESQGVCAGRD